MDRDNRLMPPLWRMEWGDKTWRPAPRLTSACCFLGGLNDELGHAISRVMFHQPLPNPVDMLEATGMLDTQIREEEQRWMIGR